MAYSDPTQPMVRSKEIPIRVIVTKLDPDFEADRRREMEYKFVEREFKGNVSKRGAYDGTVPGWVLEEGEWDDDGYWDDTSAWRDA